MPGNNEIEAFDLNGLKDNKGKEKDEDLDDINFDNYKGIYANEENGQKYQCPETGAHFEYKDLCKRILKASD